MKRILLIISLCVALCLFAGCEKTARETVFAMDTVMDLQVWGKEAGEAVEALQALLARQEATWSTAREDSALSLLNQGQGVATGEMEGLFGEALELSRRTGGAFDPKLGDVIALWGFQTKDYHVPAREELEAALAREQWALGALIKGATGRQAVDLLEGLEVDRALLNLGGNVQTYGEKPDGQPWQIGIQDPDGGQPVGILRVTGTMAVVTSGDYQRYFQEDGVKYHHILDPKTGMPADSGLRSVTVICEDGLVADGLSTALFVMGLEDATAHWRENRDFEAVFITAEGKVYATQGADLQACEFEVLSA